MSIALSVLLTAACVAPKPTPTSQPAAAESTPARPTVAAIYVENLADLQCGSADCTVSTARGTYALDPKTLQLGPLKPGAVTPPASVALNEAPPSVAERWNQQIQEGWRSPFQEVVPTPSGGRVTYQRSLQTDGARLMRTGGRMYAVPAPYVPGPLAYRRWLALHPTGQQAYLVPWPHTEVIALDPDRLVAGWRLDLEEPTLGLFVDATGHYLVAETGAVPPEDRLLDYSGDPLAVPDGVDPAGDPHISQIPRPPATHTVVIHLTRQFLAAQLPGTYKRWIEMDDAVLIATTESIGRLPLD